MKTRCENKHMVHKIATLPEAIRKGLEMAPVQTLRTSFRNLRFQAQKAELVE